MVDVFFERPVYDPAKSPEQNLAVFERWATELTNTLTLMVAQINKGLEDDE